MEEVLDVLLVVLGIATVFVLTSAFFLWIAANLAGVDEATFGRSILAVIATAVVATIVAVICIVSQKVDLAIGSALILTAQIVTIKGVYDTSFAKALLVWVFDIILKLLLLFLCSVFFSGLAVWLKESIKTQ